MGAILIISQAALPMTVLAAFLVSTLYALVPPGRELPSLPPWA